MNLEQLRDDFLTYARIATKDGKTTPFKLNRLQRMLWNMLLQDIKDGKLPRYTILKWRRWPYERENDK